MWSSIGIITSKALLQKIDATTSLEIVFQALKKNFVNVYIFPYLYNHQFKLNLFDVFVVMKEEESHRKEMA